MPEALCADRICLSPERILHNGVLLIDKDRVLDVCTRQELGRPDFPVQDLGARTIVPAPLNLHTHLEFSHLLGRVQAGQGFAVWVRSLLRQDMNGCDLEALATAARQLQACGTVHVADICSRHPKAVLQALEQVGLGCTLCGEISGFAPLPDDALPLPQAFLPLPQKVLEQAASAGHALYSTSVQRLQRAQAWSREQGRPFFLHLAEHEEEERLLTQGEGPLAQLLRGRLLPAGWKPPGRRPVALAHELGLLAPDTVAVHCVRLVQQEVELLADCGVTVCLCPRSNAFIDVGQAPVPALLAAGVCCALGTDSLASNDDLDIWAELRHIFRLTQPAAPNVLPLALELSSANAARVLGLRELGALTPGMRAAWTVAPRFLEELTGR